MQKYGASEDVGFERVQWELIARDDARHVPQRVQVRYIMDGQARECGRDTTCEVRYLSSRIPQRHHESLDRGVFVGVTKSALPQG